MPTDTRIWRVTQGDRLEEIPSGRLDREERLETWLERDIGILSPNLMVIGRQVQTDHGGFIDLLCIDESGNLTIVEMKRDKTPREITAQALDYASWVAELSHEDVTRIAESYFAPSGTSFAAAFEARFNSDIPEILNENHSMVVLGSRIDDSSERIVRYLSEKFDVPINAASFRFLGSPEKGGEFLARTFLLEPSEVVSGGGPKSKRAPNLSPEQLAEIATERDVRPLFDLLVSGFRRHFKRQTTKSSLGFTAGFGSSRKTVLTLIPGESSSELGVSFHAYTNRLSALLRMQPEEVRIQFPPNSREWKYTDEGPDWEGHAGYFDLESAQRFISFLDGCSALEAQNNG